MSTITTTINHGITLGATYTSPLTITNTGAVKNNGTGKGVFGGTATVVNDGRITATGNSGGYGYQGVYLGNGYLNNQGAITAAGNAVVFQGTGSVVNSGVVYGGRWGVTSRGLFTITNTGTISGGSEGVVLSGGGFIDNSKLISGADGIGIGGGAGTVDNSGTISSYGAAVALNSGGTVSNAGAGLLSVSGQYAAIYITGGAGTVTNAGTLSGYNGASFVGAYNNTLIDSGTIIGSGGTAVAFSSGNDLLQFQPSNSINIQGAVYGGGGTNTLEFASGATAGTLTGAGLSFDNFATGTVDVGANWTLAGSVTLGSGLTLTNSGTLADAGTLRVAGTVAGGITLASGAAPLSIASTGRLTDSSGNAIYGGAVGTWTINNLGTVQGGASASNYGVFLRGNGSVTNGSSGSTAALIGGRIGIEILGTAQISNYGTLSGVQIGAELGGPGTVANHAGALISGTNDGIILNGAAETARNSGTITGAVGVVANANGDVVVNGSSGGTAGLISGSSFGAVLQANGSDTIFNYATIIGGVGIYDNAGGGTLNATVINAGTIIGIGGTAISAGVLGISNLLLRFVPGNAFIQGKVVGEHNGVGILQFASGASAGTLTGSNADFVNFQTASVDAGASWVFAGSNTIDTGVSLVNSGTLQNSGTLTVTGTLVDAGTLINAGQINANAYGLNLAPGGYLRNNATGTISRIGGSVAGLDPAVNARSGGASTIVNLGTILNLSPNAGVLLQGGGSLTNGASAASSALIVGDVGIYALNAPVTISNFATIEGNTAVSTSLGIDIEAGGAINNTGTAALIRGQEYGIVFRGGSGTLSNSGTILAVTADGVQIRTGVPVTNTGVIAGGRNGVSILTVPGTVVNSGTIVGTSGYGLTLAAGGTITDSGAISGASTAVVFGGSASNRLILEHGYALHGRIVGSASASNTLQLLGTSSAASVSANYNALSLVNFGTVAFAPGAGNYATLTITNTAALPGTIAGFIGSHDTIDLTTLSDVGNDATTSFDTLTNVLTVTGDNGSVQLRLDSETYTGIGWLTTNDGSGGTDITALGGVVAPVISGAVSGQTVNDNATDRPFSSVLITDANSATTPETLTITLTNGGTPTDADGTLTGTGLSKTGTGIYTLAGTNAADASAKLDALIFTPTSHQVASGGTVTTGFTIAVSDGLAAQATNTSTSVIATAVGSVSTAPSITGTKANQGVANQTPSTPFATVTEVDSNVGETPTVTVSLSAPGNGTLSNLSGGTYNAATGVYQVTGSAAADTAALEALVFTPIAQPNVDVTTTVFTISPGTGGTADHTTSVTSVQQILSLADVPASQIVISVSPDGTGFGAAVGGKTNEAVVSSPAEGGTYTVPTGYQALFAGGTNDATLSDSSVGNAILVANSGNDQLFANAANDVLVAGSGNDSLYGGSFANTVVGGSGAATVFAGSGPMQVIDGTGPLTFVGGAGSATVSGGAGAETMTAGAGGLVYVAAAAGHATINSGTGSVTLFGASGGALNLTGNSGNPDYLVAGDGNETLNASGSSSSNWLSVSTAVTSPGSVAMIGGSGNDTLVGGSAPGSSVMTGGDGANAFVFFRQIAGGARDIITDFNANDAVFIEGYGQGSAAALQNAAIVGTGGLTLTLSDNTTITFSNLTSAQSLNGKIQYG